MAAISEVTPLMDETRQQEIIGQLEEASQHINGIRQRILHDPSLGSNEREDLQRTVILLQRELDNCQEALGGSAKTKEKKKDKNKEEPNLQRNFMIMGSFVTASLATKYFSSNIVLYTILTTLAMSASKTVMRQLAPEQQIAFHAATLPLGAMIHRLAPSVDANTVAVALFLGTLGRTIREVLLKKSNPRRDEFCAKVQTVGNNIASLIGCHAGRIGRSWGLLSPLGGAPSIV